MAPVDKETELLDRINASLAKSGASVIGMVQDCLSLARLKGETEWSLYFELQLGGIALDGNSFFWKGDPSHLAWQPAELFARDRRKPGGKISGYALEELESLLAKQEAAQASPPRNATWGELTKISESVTLSKQYLTQVRTRVRLFVAHAESTPRIPSSSTSALVNSLGPDPLRHIAFIGHGRSLVWRELAEFLQGRLGLAWEEFQPHLSGGQVDR